MIVELGARVPVLLALPCNSQACEAHGVRAQVRAGEGESEAAGTVLTNPVWKTSTYSGLSTRGRAQVQAPLQTSPSAVLQAS